MVIWKHSLSHLTGDHLQNILSAVKVIEYQITHEQTPDASMLAEIKQSIAELKQVIEDYDDNTKTGV